MPALLELGFRGRRNGRSREYMYDLEVEVSSNASEQEDSSDDDESGQTATLLAIYHRLYNNPSYSRILIGSLQSVFKWRKVLRIKRIIYVSVPKEK